jgi:ketosteroid isomerase-like protein
MNTQEQSAARALLERFHRAMNQHDLDAFVGCFTSDYDSKQPIHPGRAFVGNGQVRRNWTHMFEEIPDFQGDLLRSAVSGDTIWTEWDWHGTQADGTPFHVAAAIIFNVQDGCFAWGRLYMEPVDVP